MATREEWLSAFEARENRQATLEEFSAAKAKGFETSDSASSTVETAKGSDAKSAWLSQFEQSNGRKPSPEEFVAAKKNNFVLEEAAVAAAGPAAVQSESAEASVTSAVEETPTAMSPQAAWLSEFEAEHGRKPSPGEFLAAKGNHFALEAFSWTAAAGQEEAAPVEESQSVSESLRPQSEEVAAVTPAEGATGSAVPVQDMASEQAADFQPKSQQERWLAYFEEVKGRKPSPEEFFAAKGMGFAMSGLEAETPQNTEYLHLNEETQEGLSEETSGGADALEETAGDSGNEGAARQAAVSPNIKKGKRAKSAVVKAAKAHKPRKSKRVPMVISSVLAFVVLVGLIVFGFFYYSKDNQLARLRDLLNTRDAAQIAKVVQVDDPKFKVDATSLKPFISYLDQNPSYASSLANAIGDDTASQASSDLYSEISGSHFLIFPNYVLKMNLVYPSIDVAQKGTTVKLGNKDLGVTSNDTQTLQAGEFVPGSYALDAKFLLNGQTLDNSRMVNLVRYDNSNFSQSLSLSFKFSTATIRCASFPDAEIWVDGKKMGHLNGGIARLPMLAINDDTEVYLKKVFPSATLESNHVKMTEGQPDITLDFSIYSGNISDYKTIINNFLDQFYKMSDGTTQNANLIDYLEKGASTPQYNDFVAVHFAKIKAQNDAFQNANDQTGMYYFVGYYYKYNQDADIQLVDISNNELVFNVNYSETQYWDMQGSYNNDPNADTDGDGYQNFHWTGRQIIIDSGQVQSLLQNSSNYDSSTGYIKIRSFGSVKGDAAVNDPNINWNSLY